LNPLDPTIITSHNFLCVKGPNRPNVYRQFYKVGIIKLYHNILYFKTVNFSQSLNTSNSAMCMYRLSLIYQRVLVLNSKKNFAKPDIKPVLNFLKQKLK